MRYRKSTSVSLDETTANDAGEWAKKEHLQLSSYIEEAVEMRNRWHERNEEKEKMKTNLLTKEQAKKELLAELEQKANQSTWDDDLQKAYEIAKQMWK